jgi:hypothetical protein
MEFAEFVPIKKSTQQGYIILIQLAKGSCLLIRTVMLQETVTRLSGAS